MKNALSKLYHRLPLIRELDLVIHRIGNLHETIDRGKSVPARHLVDWLRFTDPRHSDERRLLKYSFQVNSQNGEDGIIQEIFRRIGPGHRIFFESGVGDGSENNTCFLLSQGWTGFWVDASPRFQNVLEKAGLLDHPRISHLISKLNRENILEILAQLKVPRELDLFSLDIDQNTYHVWKAIGAEYRPRVIVVEYNGALPAGVEWAVQYDAEKVWDGTINFGASLKAYEILGRSLGYSLVGCDPLGVNAFFVRDDLVGDHFAAPFTSENHFEPARYHLIHRMGLPASVLDRPQA